MTINLSALARRAVILLPLLALLVPFSLSALEIPNTPFPRPLHAYHDGHIDGIWATLVSRAEEEPFNLIAFILFVFAIVHTLFAQQFTKLAEKVEEHHAQYIVGRQPIQDLGIEARLDDHVSFKAEMLYFLGEVEVIFGIWVIPIMLSITYYFDWSTMNHYLNTRDYTEPMFVVVIMTLSATRPILKLVEDILRYIANLVGGGSPSAWWWTILTVCPLLGSFVTEPGAITIGALLLGKQFYRLKPSNKLAYATLGLLFVNISVGGVLTHFAAPPVLMVAKVWGWGMSHMLVNFGWKAVIGIFTSNTLYYLYFKKELSALVPQGEMPERLPHPYPMPKWIVVIHVFLIAWTVFNAHNPVIFMGSFFMFLGFHQATAPHQNRVNLKPAILVGFFLAGLLIHGGLQGWWISVILANLPDNCFMFMAMVLTAFNDNAVITYLTTLVPGFTDPLKYAVVAGAVSGGGLTVIANAPNPAGQLILQKHFEGGISPIGLFTSAAIPTLIMFLSFTYL